LRNIFKANKFLSVKITISFQFREPDLKMIEIKPISGRMVGRTLWATFCVLCKKSPQWLLSTGYVPCDSNPISDYLKKTDTLTTIETKKPSMAYNLA
jgi:hypothetical protein